MSLLPHKWRLCYIRSGLSAGAEKLLRYKRHYVVSDFAISNQLLVTQRRILAGTKNWLHYIRHFVISDFVISDFDWTVSSGLHTNKLHLPRNWQHHFSYTTHIYMTPLNKYKAMRRIKCFHFAGSSLKEHSTDAVKERCALTTLPGWQLRE